MGRMRLLPRSLMGLYLLCAILAAGLLPGARAAEQGTTETQAVLAGVIRPTASGFERIPSAQAETTEQTRWGESLIVAPTDDPRPALLRQGLAQRLPEDGADTEALRAAEAEAIANRRGLWANPCCGVIAPADTERLTQHWRVVQGRIVSVTARRDVTYLNFGADWKTDFTVILPARLARTLSPESWAGSLIEVRGWIHWRNGPAITVDVPEQIRLIPSG